MFDEVVAVAAAEGVELDRDAAWARATRVFVGAGEHYTSMCTDVRAGRRTELADMSGRVVRLGVAHGVPVPVHRTVLDLLDIEGIR
jgi:2-dehydropantoate 2-reductase